MPLRTISSLRKKADIASSKSLSFTGGTNTSYCPVTLSENGFNIAFWIRRTASNCWFFTTNTADNTNGVEFFYNNNKFELIMRNGGSSVGSLRSNPTSNNRNKYSSLEWYHVVVTFAPNNATLYINGVVVETDTSCVITAGDTALWFNRRSKTGNYNNSNFKLSRLVIQNTATPWTADQVADLYYKNIVPTGATFWSLNNTNLDANGGNALTLQNTSYSTDNPIGYRTILTTNRTRVSRTKI